MAVNVQKLLPSTKSVALAKVSQSIAKPISSSVVTEKTQTSISIIRVKVIKIDKLLKGTLASQKKKLDDKKRKESFKRREKIEEKLETKTNAEKGKIEFPKIPSFGIFDWIKNFIGNVILGYFAVRLIDHLPKIIPIVKFIGKATDFVLDIGGKLLNGLVTFIDWGYKAVDFSRGLVGKTFGDEALKNFDKLTSEFEKFMNLAIIVGMASADFGMERLGTRGGAKAGFAAGQATAKLALRAGSVEARAITSQQRIASRATEKAQRRIAGAQIRAGLAAGKAQTKLTTKIGSKLLKAVPFLGAGLAIVEGIMRIKEGDYVGGLLSFGSAIPVAGWAFLALDVAREFMGGQEFDKSVGKAFGGTPGVTDQQVQKRTSSMSGPSFMGFAGGGQPTRGGKVVSNRTQRRIQKTKTKRQVSVQPTQIKPGADVGGEKNIEKVFPKSEDKNQVSPLDYIEKSYKTTSQDLFFGSLLNLQTKSLVGQKPNKVDYKNAAQGLSNWMNITFSDEILRTGALYAAGGGEINAEMLERKSGDMTDAIAKSLEDSISKRIDATLDELMKQMMLKKEETEKPSVPGTQPTDGEFLPGSVAGGQMTIEQLVGLAKGAGFDDNEAVIMAAIAMAESRGNSRAHNKKPPDNSYGLWQINMIGDLGPARLREYKLSNYEQLFDPVTNAKAAYAIRKSQGLSAWSVYKSGSYKNFLGQAQAAKNAPSLRVSPSTSISSLGPGYGSEGSKIAGELGRFLKKKGVVPGSIHRHPEHPPYSLTSGHSKDSYHYQGRAIDLGGYTNEQGPILSAIAEFNKIKGVKPVQLLHGGNEPRNHWNHVHVAYFHGGLVKKDGLHKPHKGEFVIDKDSVNIFGRDFVATINEIENKTQLKQKANALISRLQNYTDYESPQPEIVMIPIPTPTIVGEGGYSSTSGGSSILSVGSEEDPFETLYQGG